VSRKPSAVPDRTDRGRKTPADVLGEPPVARDKPPTNPARVFEKPRRYV